MDKSELARLKELAQTATPGPWAVDAASPYMVVTGEAKQQIGVHLARNNAAFRIFDATDTAYIAAANPRAILELIADIERLNKEADWLAGKLADASGSMFDDEMEDMGFQCSQQCEQVGCTLDCRRRNWRQSARKAMEASNA